MTDTLILGLGVEGAAAAGYFLQHSEGHVYATDVRPENDAVPVALQFNNRFTFLSAKDAEALLDRQPLFLRSPGISPNHPLVIAATTRGLPVTTPTGYWLEHLAPPHTVTVTGTKGKSTTVSLIAFILSALGKGSAAMGNIGQPPLGPAMAWPDYPVLELSSYMMHDLPAGQYTHIVTSLYKEHTTWHGSEESYRAAKLRPFRFDPPAPGFAPRNVIDQENLPNSVVALEERLPINGDQLLLGDTPFVPASLNAAFSVGPSLYALRAACCVALQHTDPDTLRSALEAALPVYAGLPSRQEIIPSTDDRVWVNDALATVPEAVAFALGRWRQPPVTLIIGGADRGQRFTGLAEAVRSHGEVLPILFGSIEPIARADFSAAGVEAVSVDSYAAALDFAKAHTVPGGVVLFSPAAATEEPYKDYKERAALFRLAATAGSPD
ncbi:UDP-N-acetylmuramoyl-L-alanine--D-glutamate ligase [Parvularcula sp. LCG005]|uniref:UDP-N-acetylmuramoyl-L-alanine--D-glutamate ligase n=1 Tax=Parvularcula sp. LCG005 TaxID=3078805 RepID=UPI00294340CC|nr:UDP-N-acetylmuramoyl-L-alanine--D-glutamate ligase [Parvularcula sp. LCG005]WOI52551.1 UDP-N-acetylmuramoyl-L-alanine--D-glutamate ligase [Parvularcula sp. LCG005]